MTPFFASPRTQNTRDEIKQARLQTFTGTDNDFFRAKQEVATMRTESEGLNTNANGPWIGASDEERFRTYVNANRFFNNTNADPTSNTRVGPGLGIGTDVVAQGGFHPDAVLRVLPDNWNEHRVNQLDALEPAPPGALVSREERSHDEAPVRELVPRYYEEAQHPTLPTGGVLQKATAYGTHLLRDTLGGREDHAPDLWGGASPQAAIGGSAIPSRTNAVASGDRAPPRMGESCARAPAPVAEHFGEPASRLGTYELAPTHRERCTPILNLTQTAASSHAHASRSYVVDASALTTLREQCGILGAPHTSGSGHTFSHTASEASRPGPQTYASHHASQYDRPSVTHPGTYVAIDRSANHTDARLQPALRTCGLGWVPSCPHRGVSTGRDAAFEFDDTKEALVTQSEQLRALTHGQGYLALPTREEVAEYDLRDDASWNRPPVQGRVYEGLSAPNPWSMGEVELK